MPDRRSMSCMRAIYRGRLRRFNESDFDVAIRNFTRWIEFAPAEEIDRKLREASLELDGKE